MTKKPFLLDTNVFDSLFNKNIDTSVLTDFGEYYTTNVQFSELKNIPDKKLRDNLLKLYSDLPQTKIILESGIWIDDLYWDDDQLWRDEIGQTARDLAGKSDKKPWKDALIGEIAKINNLILVTNDTSFRNKAKVIGISVMLIDEFEKFLNLTKE
jgi:predicted nucleic acid-binding protein